MVRKKALVAGALGIVGSHLCADLAGRQDGWQVVGLARGVPREPIAWRLVNVDLGDAQACRKLVREERDVTHLFYAARAAHPDPLVETPTNLRMLSNLLEPLLEYEPALEHVSMMHGTKWYGAHLGPYRTPAREDDPRHFPPNFYFDQLDYVAARQRGQRWSWSALRPHIVCGYALGYPHNIVAAIGAYAAICRELKQPFRFPGARGCYEAVCQATDASLLAQAAVWAGTTPACANQSFNIVNGDLFRWRHLWERLADYFELPLADVQTVSLSRLMSDKGEVWKAIVERNGLRPLQLGEVANWSYADMTFSQAWDHISSPTKSRTFGFPAFADTEAMFITHLERYRCERVLP